VREHPSFKKSRPPSDQESTQQTSQSINTQSTPCLTEGELEGKQLKQYKDAEMMNHNKHNRHRQAGGTHM